VNCHKIDGWQLWLFIFTFLFKIVTLGAHTTYRFDFEQLGLLQHTCVTRRELKMLLTQMV
jgi:hypothetical protein